MATLEEKIRALLDAEEAAQASFLDVPEPETPPRVPYGAGLRRVTLHDKASELSLAAQKKPEQFKTPPKLPVPASPDNAASGYTAAPQVPLTAHKDPELINKPLTKLQSVFSSDSNESSDTVTPGAPQEENPVFMPTYIPSTNHRRLTTYLDENFEKKKDALHPFPTFGVPIEGREKLGPNFLAYCWVRNSLIERWFKSKGKPVPKEALLWSKYAVEGEDADKRKSTASSGSDGLGSNSSWDALSANSGSSKAGSVNDEPGKAGSGKAKRKKNKK